METTATNSQDMALENVKLKARNNMLSQSLKAN